MRRPTRRCTRCAPRLLRRDEHDDDARAGEPAAARRVRRAARRRTRGPSACCRRRRRTGTRVLARATDAASYVALTSRNSLRAAARAARVVEPGPDGLVGGRLEHHARAAAVADRRRAAVAAPESAAGTRAARAPADVLRAPARRGPRRLRRQPHSPPARARQAEREARARGRRPRVDWAGAATPLIVGGDFNLRPAQHGRVRSSSSATSASPRPPRRTRSITCWRAAWTSSGRPPPGRRSAASWRCTSAWRCAACGCPTMLRSRRLLGCDSVCSDGTKC